MQKYLKRIGIVLVIVAFVNCLLELSVCLQLFSTGINANFSQQSISGIILKNLLCMGAGIFVLCRMGKENYHGQFRLVLILATLVVPVVMLTTEGTFPERVDALIGHPFIPMAAILYTLTVLDIEEAQWKTVVKNEPLCVDLRLCSFRSWFNPIQIGPRFAVAEQYADVLNRFIASTDCSHPLVINLFCRESVSDVMQDTMRETLRMYYDDEVDRIRNGMLARHRRILLIFSVSFVFLVIWKSMSQMFQGLIYWEIIGNVAIFGLWQVGYLHFDQQDLREELVRMQIGRHAQLHFVQPKTEGREWE